MDDRQHVLQSQIRAVEGALAKVPGDTMRKKAKYLDVGLKTLYNWQNGDTLIDPGRAVRLSWDTGIDLARLRPDLWDWNYIAERMDRDTD